jgi:hypothetical protein
MTLKDLRVIKVISKHGEVKVVEVVGVFGLFWLLGKFIEIDCLRTVLPICTFRRNRPKNPASGGWGRLPQNPRLAFFGNTSPCLVISTCLF